MTPLPFAPSLPVPPPPPNFFPSLAPQSPHWSQQYSPTAHSPYPHPSVPYQYPYNLPQPLPLPPPPLPFGAHHLQPGQSSFLLHRQQLGSSYYSDSAGGGSSPMKIDLGAGTLGAGKSSLAREKARGKGARELTGSVVGHRRVSQHFTLAWIPSAA